MKIIMPSEQMMRDQNELYKELIATLRGDFNTLHAMLTNENLTEAQKKDRIYRGVENIKARWEELERQKKEIGCNSCFWEFERAYGSAKETIKSSSY